MLKSVKGIGKENATEFVNNIPGFMEFLKEADLEYKLTDEYNVKNTSVPKIEISEQAKSNPLFGKKIVMSKIRDKEIIEKLPLYGATLEDSMKKDIFVLIIKSLEETSSKTEYAKKNGIPIMTPEQFKETYLQ